MFDSPGLPIGDQTSARPAAWVQGHRMFLHEPAVDRFISTSLAAAGVFEPFETEWVQDEVRAGDMVLDIGAHIGYYTLLFARLVGPAGRVVAFEPDPDNFALLERNVALNGYRNVTLVRAAVSDRAGPARLCRSADNAGDHRLHDPAGARCTVDVETLTLDGYFAAYDGPVNLVKMDVQGAEVAALRGMRGLLGRLQRVKLVTEFWPYGLQVAGETAAGYLALLKELGLRLYELDERRLCLTRTDAQQLLTSYPVREDTFTNLVAVKRGPAGQLLPGRADEAC